MKVFIAVLLLLSFSAISYAESTAKYDTPFTIEWRKRYEANNVMLRLVIAFGIKECRENCSKKDITAIKQLAKQGDKFALGLYPFFSSPEQSGVDAIKMAADKGEPHHMSTYASIKDSDYKIANEYLSSVVQQGAFVGYGHLLRLYIKFNKNLEYCELLGNAYKKFGLELIGTNLIYADIIPNKQANAMIMQCLNKTESEILATHGNEGKLVQGYKYVYEKKYQEAYSIFEKLYVSGDSSKISTNAGYCLGMMKYYGKGTKESKKDGRALLKESFDNGVIYPDTPEQKGMPAKLEITSHGNGNCNGIK